MRTRLLLIAAGLSIVLAAPAHAASIGISYVTIDQSTYLAPTDVAGVVPQAHWNNVKVGGPAFGVGLSYLSDDSGNETSSRWPTFFQQVTTSVAPTTPNGKLLHGGTLPPVSVESPYQHFDLYLYLQPGYLPVTPVFVHLSIPGPGRSVLLDATSSSELIEATSSAPGNYLRFSNLSNPFFQISPNPFSVAITLTPEVVIAGVQIVEVPEPAGWLLALVGAVSAIAGVRRRASRRSK
jgi:hypothetical protein